MRVLSKYAFALELLLLSVVMPLGSVSFAKSIAAVNLVASGQPAGDNVSAPLTNILTMLEMAAH